MRQEASKTQAVNNHLGSWKEIAAYLGCDDRTAKRWEKSRGLPVHRLPGVRSGVFAFSRELEEWRRQTPPAVDAEPTTATEDFSEAIELPAAAVVAVSSNDRFAVRYAYAASAFLFLGLTASLFYFARVTGATAVNSHAPSTHAFVVSAHVPPKDAEDLYLKGRYFWNKRTAADLQTALDFFKQAIHRDPEYARAYIGLADTYSLLVEFAAMPPSEAYPPSIAAARKAIALDPSLPEAHRSLAFSLFYWNWDYVLSENEFRKALEIEPGNATTHHWFANTLSVRQRPQDALAEIEKARELDPYAISTLVDRAHIILTLPGRQQEARDVLLQIEKDTPAFLPAHWYLAFSYWQAKEDVLYISELQKIADITHSLKDAALFAAAKKGFSINGDAGLSEALANEDLILYKQGAVPAFEVAYALSVAGRPQEALPYLERAYASRDTQFVTLKNGDGFPMLKNDPIFRSLVEKSNSPYPLQEQASR